jgi:hypothetical protein
VLATQTLAENKGILGANRDNEAQAKNKTLHKYRGEKINRHTGRCVAFCCCGHNLVAGFFELHREPGRQIVLLRVPRPLRGFLLDLRRTLCHPGVEAVGGTNSVNKKIR